MRGTETTSTTQSTIIDESDFQLEGEFRLIRNEGSYLLRAIAGSHEADQLHQLRMRLQLKHNQPKRGWQQLEIKRRNPNNSEKMVDVLLKGIFGINYEAGPFRILADLDSESAEYLLHAKREFGKAHKKRSELHGEDFTELMLGQVVN